MTTPTKPLTERLKSENWDMHQIAERGRGVGSVLRGELSLPEYLELIDQGYLVHAAMDEAVKGAAGTRPRLAPLMSDEHLLGPKYAADLAHFGVAPGSVEPISGTERFVAHIESVKGEPLEVLGLHYVRTGASNGNSFVAKAARKAFELPESGEGTAHLVPYGDAQRANWAEFKSNLDALELSEQEQDTVVASARKMYELFICWQRDEHLTADALLAMHKGSLNKDDFDRAHAQPQN